jgi:hypothetical protein
MAAKIKCVCGKEYSWKPQFAGKRAKCKCGQVISFPATDPEAAAEAQEFDEAVRGLEPYETTESGQAIYRHETRTKPFEPAFGDEKAIDAITRHIEKFIGPADNVFHELISDLVHVDIHVVQPTPERNWYTLVTSGMSDKPMTVPDDDPELQEFKHAELLMCLPPDWPMDQESWEDENNYWPIRWLKIMARMPHEYDTWLGWGHTVPNGDPPEPLAPGTEMCCMLVMPPVLVDEKFYQLKVGKNKLINFYALYPIYKEEMDHKLKKGAEGIVEKFSEAEVTELLDMGRKNTCKKKFGLF